MSKANTQLLVKNLLHPIVENLNIKDDYSVDIKDSTTKGEGYVGSIWRAKINHGNKTTDLVIKLASEEDDHRNLMKAAVLYRNEVHFYTKVFPAMDHLQKEKKVKHPLKIAKCYYTSLQEKEESLVLEDLKAASFELHNRKEPLDEAHVSLVLAQYGKFHALSFALRDQQPETFKTIAASLTDSYLLVIPNFLEAFTTQILRNAEMLQQRGLIAESKLAERLALEINEICCKEFETDNPYSVIMHGDCWNNNMLYKYDKETGKPVDHRFLDFQISRINFPVFDLSHFFYASAPKHIMDDVDKYLKIYYKSFSDFLRQLGSDPDVLFPFEALQKLWEKYRTFGLVMSMIIFRFMLAEGDDTLCLTNKEAVEDGFNKEMSNQEEHDRRVTAVLKHFVESNGVW